MLTEGTDKIPGTDKNDIFEANGTTLTAFDKIDGREGIDTLQIRDAAGAMGTVNPVGMEIVNVEKMTVQTAGSFGQIAAAGTPAQAQINTYDFTASTTAGTIVVNYGSSTSTITTIGNPAIDAATFADAINAAAGQDITTVAGNTVVVTAPTAGTALPSITFGAVTGLAVIPTIAFTQANVASVAASSTNAVYDVSGIADLTDVKVTTAVNVNLKAAATTDVSVSGTTGAVAVDGGKNVVVTDATAAKAITVGNGVAGGDATGTITITDTDNSGAANTINVEGGTNVTVTATATASNGVINVGNATNGTATGDVVVTQNLNSTGAAALTGGAITLTGGKTVTVNVNSTNDGTKGNAAIETGLITVNGDANTTTVTVNQTEAVTAAGPATPATPAVTEVASVKFVALTATQTVTLDGLTFTAAKALTAAEVAAAFANLKAGATHGGAKADNGIYSGKLANYNTGAVSTDTVVFTATEAKVLTDLTNGGTALAHVITTTTQGVAAADAVTAVGAITNGQVVINGTIAGTHVLKTVTVDGYANGLASAPSSITSNALTDLTLKNSTANATMTLTSTVASLNVTLDDINGTVDLDGAAGGAATLKTLNLTTTGEASDIILDAKAVETLTIAAAADLDITGSTLSALKTVTITGAENVDLGNLSAVASFATLTASAATGDITATVSGLNTAVTTGSGNDSIVVTTTTVAKAITLGAGNDKLNLSAFTTVDANTAAIAGGEGSDTVVLAAANAANTALSSLPNSIVFNSKVTGFEKLSLDNDIAANTSVNVGRLGFNHVITNAIAAGALTLDDMANNGKVELNAAVNTTDSVVVNVKDAAGEADVLNVILNAEEAGENAGTLTVASVERINISTVDLDADEELDAATTLDLVANTAKTVAITGNADLILNITSTTVTKVDASALTGKLVYIADDNTTAGTEVIGGAGNDELTASGDSDILIGGAGNDTLVSDDYATLTGGTGADIFVASTIANKDALATITDFKAAEGDSIKFANAANFINTAVATNSLSFEAALNKAIEKAGANEVTWFQFTSNSVTDTYLVYDGGADNATFDPTTGNDMVIKVAGVVDFSTAAFNNDTDTIAFA